MSRAWLTVQLASMPYSSRSAVSSSEALPFTGSFRFSR